MSLPIWILWLGLGLGLGLGLQELDGVIHVKIALDNIFTISNTILLLLPSRYSYGILLQMALPSWPDLIHNDMNHK
jgi:hypothetical protein